MEARFKKEFGVAPALVLYSPGRVNLIGEHTDYNDGFSLPCAIDLGLRIAISLRNDGKLNMISDIDGQLVQSDMNTMPSKDCWSLYPTGLAKEFKLIAAHFNGFDMMIESSLPLGSGLSSSAALLCGLGQCLKKLLSIEIDNVDFCMLVQQIELKYLGKKTGLMDQMAICFSKANNALFIDFANMSHRPVEFPDDLQLIIFHSGIYRSLSASEYNKRVESCQQACKILGIKSLRELVVDDLIQVQKKLEGEVFKRVRHVITENFRVEQFADALSRGFKTQLFQLLRSSHQSLSRDYEVSTTEIDCLANFIQEALGDKGGVRLTGGGFGGCLVALSTFDELSEIWPDIKKTYRQQTGMQAKIWSSEPVNGLFSSGAM